MKFSSIPLIILLICCSNNLSAQSDFEFYGDKVTPGSKRHWQVSLKNEKDTVLVPVTVFHGVRPGPVLGITAGVHGYEYSPILAGQQLIDRLDPTEISGTVILVQVANMGSFLGRSPFINPLDGKNLNRSFPGNKNGTITERVAHFISTEVIGRSTHFIDMHSGDAPEDLVGYVGYYQNDDKPGVSQIGRSMAEAAGFEYIVEFKTTGKSYLKEGQPSLYCSAEAFKRNIPAMDFECGRLGQIEPGLVSKIVSGVERIMGSLDMTNDKVEKVSGQIFFPVRSYVSSEYDGIFYPLKKAGDYVSKGTHLGYITDFFGKRLQEIHAPENGVILLIIGTPPINKGESVVGIGIVK